jgi:hypothetical protein
MGSVKLFAVGEQVQVKPGHEPYAGLQGKVISGAGQYYLVRLKLVTEEPAQMDVVFPANNLEPVAQQTQSDLLVRGREILRANREAADKKQADERAERTARLAWDKAMSMATTKFGALAGLIDRTQPPGRPACLSVICRPFEHAWIALRFSRGANESPVISPMDEGAFLVPMRWLNGDPVWFNQTTSLAEAYALAEESEINWRDAHTVNRASANRQATDVATKEVVIHLLATNQA